MTCGSLMSLIAGDAKQQHERIGRVYSGVAYYGAPKKLIQGGGSKWLSIYKPVRLGKRPAPCLDVQGRWRAIGRLCVLVGDTKKSGDCNGVRRTGDRQMIALIPGARSPLPLRPCTNHCGLDRVTYT